MNWKKVDSSNRVQQAGVYSDWKQQISDDCHNQCVYCSIHEQPWGGIDHFHIEHFRPKSKFESLEHIINNLFHACPVCNRFKSDDWPGDPNLNAVSYIDPSQVDYNTIFKIGPSTFNVIGEHMATKYMISRLYLNRPQLIYERREDWLNLRYSSLFDEVKKRLVKLEDVSLYERFMELETSLKALMNLRRSIPPYKLLEIRK